MDESYFNFKEATCQGNIVFTVVRLFHTQSDSKTNFLSTNHPISLRELRIRKPEVKLKSELSLQFFLSVNLNEL